MEKNNKIFSVLIISVFVLIIFNLISSLFVDLYNITGRGSLITQGWFSIDADPPAYKFLKLNNTDPALTDTVKFTVYWSDNIMIDTAWIETDENGSLEKKIGLYGSPIKFNASTGWSNFTWYNPNVTGELHWRIFANDSSGNINQTPIGIFFKIEEEEEERRGRGPVPSPVQLVSNYTIDKDFIKVTLKQGETTLDNLKITNNGQTALVFNLSVDGLEENVIISETNFRIEPGDSKLLTIVFAIEENGHSDIHLGRINVNAGGIAKVVLLAMEVKSLTPLFDVYLNLKAIPQIALAGNEIEGDIILFNFGDSKPVDVVLFYALKDFDGNDILFHSETMAVEEQKILRKKIKIPSDIEPGFYLYYARLEYNNQTAVSSSLIKVVEKLPVSSDDIFYSDIILILIAILIIGTISIVLLINYNSKKRTHNYLVSKYEKILDEEKIAKKEASRKTEKERAAIRIAEIKAEEERIAMDDLNKKRKEQGNESKTVTVERKGLEAARRARIEAEKKADEEIRARVVALEKVKKLKEERIEADKRADEEKKRKERTMKKVKK